MCPSATEFVLRARQVDLQNMQHLVGRAAVVEAVGQLVHALQWERGCTSLFMASEAPGRRAQRAQAVTDSLAAEAVLRETFTVQLAPESGAGAPLLSLMGWVLLDLDNLRALRAAIELGGPSGADAVAGYSRVLAGLIELVFHVANEAADPRVSRVLVALVHLFQVKEAAGQERALGAHLLASGVCDDDAQRRFIHLIEAQERAAEVLLHFIDDGALSQWQQAHASATMVQQERMRRNLCMAKAGAPLDATQSDAWFETCTARIGELHKLESTLQAQLRAACQSAMSQAQQDLQDSHGLVQRLRENPPPHTQAMDRFYSAGGGGEDLPTLPSPSAMQAAVAAERAQPTAEQVAALQSLLKEQATRLDRTEQELQKARQALSDRKVIERAKWALMSRLGLSEDAAYRALQKVAMDNNKRLLDVAESTLALSDIALGGQAGGQTGVRGRPD